MITIIKQPHQVRKAQEHERFLEMLPRVRRQAHRAFHRFRPELRDELVQEVEANAFCAFVALVHRGKADVAYATPLANYAIRQVIAGRQVGTRPNRRDVLSPNAHADYGIVVERLDMFDEEQGEWRAVLVEDRRATPADIAAARIDVATWLRSLTQRNRRIAKALARGETTSDVAQQFKLSSARISQIRDELKTSWESFQGIRPAIQCFQCPYQATAQ